MDKNLLPRKKVSAGAVAGALTTLIVWGIGLGGVVIPAAVAAALTVILTTVVAYLVPDAD